MRRWSAALAVTTGLAAAGLSFAPTASAAPVPSAGSLASATTPCPVPSPVLQPLLQYYDSHWYYLVTNGSFTDGTTGWRTSGTVYTIPESAPADVMGAGGGSLVLGPGSTATTLPFCTDSGHDRTRFFYRGSGRSATTLQVKVTSTSNFWYAGSYTSTSYLDASSSTWRLSPTLAVPDWTYSSGRQQTTISFTAIGGSVQIDDVMVDPWRYTT